MSANGGGRCPAASISGRKLERTVTDLVRIGRYNSRSEVLREGVRVVEERETRLATLDAAIARSLADVDAGRVRPLREVADRLIGKYQAMSEAGSIEVLHVLHGGQDVEAILFPAR